MPFFWNFVLGSLKMVTNFRFFPKFSICFWEKYSELKVFICKIKSYKTFLDRNWYLSFQILFNFTFDFHPRKNNFIWKKSQYQKKSYELKYLAEILYKIVISKSLILEAEISTPTPLNKIWSWKSILWCTGGPNIAESFLPKHFGDLGKFGDMGTEINFLFK